MKQYFGIDIGGTAVKLGIVDETGRVLLKGEESVSFDGYKTPILDTVQAAIHEFLTADAPRLEGIAVSATGQIDSRRGVVAGTCGNFPGWIGVDIKGTLERAFGLPVTVANDANCMLLGEVWAGAAKGYTDVIGVTLGTGVGGVMARTLPRDMYQGTQLRHANSLLNMGILVSPLLAPLIGGILDTLWNWRACFVFLLVLCAGVTLSMARWMPETRPQDAPRTKLIASYKTLFGNGSFTCYLLMLIGGLAGIAVFEACSGVLLGAGLGLSSMVVSILFILPIPAAFFGAWFAGRPNKRFSTLMWQSVISCLLAGLMMWIPGLFGVMTVWTLLIPAALFFFGAGMLFPLATSGAMEPFPFLAGTAGALVGGLQNIGSGALAWLSAMMPQTGQGSLGLLMMLMGLLILLCWLPLASRVSHHEQPV